MTSGAGIAHAEQTPREHTGRLNGVQLWTALPDQHRHAAPGFVNVAEVPAIERPAGVVQVFAGNIEGVRSPAPYYSPLLGADVRVHPRQRLDIPLEPTYEHAVLVMSGDCVLDGDHLAERVLYYLGTTRSEASFSSSAGARVLLIGGPPFPETILMWWNFVARTAEEIAQARTDWEERRRFGDVVAYRRTSLEGAEPDAIRAPESGQLISATSSSVEAIVSESWTATVSTGRPASRMRRRTVEPNGRWPQDGGPPEPRSRADAHRRRYPPTAVRRPVLLRAR